jgi:hypothetical protein
MGLVMLRLAAILATLLGILIGAARASAQPAAPAMRPICLTDLAVKTAPPAAGAPHEITVIVSRITGAPCVVANYPQLAPADGRTHPEPLVAGRLSPAQSATVGGRTPAAFLVRFATAPAPDSPAPSASGEGTCALTVFVNGGVAMGRVRLATSCASLVALDVSSYATGTAPPVDAVATPSPAAVQSACRTHDLELRDAGADPAGDTMRERYALQNVGLGACRLSGAVNAVLRDAKGAAIVLQVAPRMTMPMLLTLPRGHDASFTIAFPGSGGPNGEQRCIAAATIAVTLATAPPVPLVAPTHVTACPPATGPGLRITNLQLGVPLPNPAR